jgi:hypothetical protein
MFSDPFSYLFGAPEAKTHGILDLVFREGFRDDKHTDGSRAIVVDARSGMILMISKTCCELFFEVEPTHPANTLSVWPPIMSTLFLSPYLVSAMTL